MAAIYDDKLECHLGVAYFEDHLTGREACVTALPRRVDPLWVEVRRDDKDGALVEGSFKAALDTWGADFESAFERAQRDADAAAQATDAADASPVQRNEAAKAAGVAW